MKFHRWFLGRGTAIIPWFNSLAESLSVLGIWLLSSWKETTSLVIIHLRWSLTLLCSETSCVFRRQLWEMTLECLPTLSKLIHRDRSLYSTVWESTGIHILLPEYIIILILLILLLSMGIYVLFRLRLWVATTDGEIAFSTRRSMHFYRCVAIICSRIGSLWILLLLAILIVATSVTTRNSSISGAHTRRGSIHVLLGLHLLFAIPHGIEIILLWNESIRWVGRFLLSELLLILVDLILILHLVVLLLWS